MSVNKLILIGNIAKDAETKDFGTSSVAIFTVVTSLKYKDRNGEMREAKEFHDVELWGNKGIYSYLVKGQQVYVEGSITTDRWEDLDGNKREKKKVRAVICQLVGDKKAVSPAPARPSIPAPSPLDEIDDMPF